LADLPHAKGRFGLATDAALCKKHISFGFWRGAEMSDPSSLLQGTGGKMRHVKIASLDDIQPEVFKAFVRAAVELNQTHGDSTKGSWRSWVARPEHVAGKGWHVRAPSVTCRAI
jgi:hypothetical protein